MSVSSVEPCLCYSKLTDLEADSQAFANQYTLNSSQRSQALKIFRTAANSSCVIQHAQAGQKGAMGHGVRIGEKNLMSTSHSYPTQSVVNEADFIFPGQLNISGQANTPRNARCLRPRNSSSGSNLSFTGQQSSVPDIGIVFEHRLEGAATAQIPLVNGAASLDPCQCNLFVVHQEFPESPSEDGWLVSGIKATDTTGDCVPWYASDQDSRCLPLLSVSATFRLLL